MRRSMRTGGQWVAVILVACIVLTGCGAGEDVASEPTAAPATRAASLTGIGDIVWTASVDPSSQAPAEPLNALPNDAPLVIAALPVDTLPAGTVLQAHWSIDGEALPSLDPEPITVEENLAGAWVTWTLRWDGDQPWPTGQLGITVDIDGAENTRAELSIERPSD